MDTSAAAKLVVAERESAALRRWLEPRDDRLFSSDLLRTELLRTTRRGTPGQMVQARAVIESLTMLRLTTQICERAALLESALLQSLDALHLAAALELGDELEGLVTYDRRLSDGAKTLGIDVVTPT